MAQNNMNMVRIFIHYFNLYQSALEDSASQLYDLLEDDNIDENELVDKLRKIVDNVFPQIVLNLLARNHIIFNNEQVQMRVLQFTDSVYKNFIGFQSIGYFNNDSKYSMSIQRILHNFLNNLIQRLNDLRVAFSLNPFYID